MEGSDPRVRASQGEDIDYNILSFAWSDPRVCASQGEVVSLVLERVAKRLIVPTDASLDRGRPSWRDFAFDDSRWQTGTGGAGYEMNRAGYEMNRAGYEMHIDPRLNVQPLVPPRSNESIYLRAVFEVADPSVLDGLVLGMKVDDGYISYINDRKVARFNVPNGPPRWDMAAAGRRDDTAATAFERLNIDKVLKWLRPGRNVLAVLAVNDDGSSCDFLIHPILEGVKRGQSEEAKVSNGLRYTKPIVVSASATLRAVVKQGAEWSALAEAYFYASVPAASGNVLISEVMYHPEDEGDAEYVEVQNVSATDAIILTGVQISGGIEFAFPEQEPLLPGHCLLFVKDRDAFRKTYGERAAIAGVYKRSLSNSKDTVVLKGVDGQVIEVMDYEDGLPWPLTADGEGRSLERLVDDSDARIIYQECG